MLTFIVKVAPSKVATRQILSATSMKAMLPCFAIGRDNRGQPYRGCQTFRPPENFPGVRNVTRNQAYYDKHHVRKEDGLIEIILTVCAIANPNNCEEKSLQFAWDGSINQCMMAAQPYIARWIGEHPAWMARRWSCDYPGSKRRQI